MEAPFLSISAKLNGVDTTEPRWGIKFKKKNLPKNRLSGTDMFFPSTKVPTHQQKIHPNVGFETTSLRVPPRHITLFKNLHQPISSTFGNNYIGVFGKSRSGFDVETQQTFHLMTSKGKNRKSVSLVIFCFVPIFWRLDMFGVSSWNHIEHVPSQLQRSPRLLFECSFDHTCYFHVYSTFHVCIYTSNISKYVYIYYIACLIYYIYHILDSYNYNICMYNILTTNTHTHTHTSNLYLLTPFHPDRCGH